MERDGDAVLPMTLTISPPCEMAEVESDGRNAWRDLAETISHEACNG